MAVDGRKFNQTLYQGSDIEHDFPCLPCCKEGKNVAAIKHCVECDENLCQKCVGDHNKFSAMRGHQLLDTVKQPIGKKQELPSQKCEKHGGKLIDVYCPGHDKVGCSTCMTVEHRSCADITFIPDVAYNTDTTQALKLLEADISTLESRFMALKQKKVKELNNAKKAKSNLIKEIQSERKGINDRLDKMEMELLKEVDATFQIQLQHIESNMKEADDRIAVLQECLQKINAAKQANGSEKYVQIKRVNEKRKASNDFLYDFETPSRTGTIRFDPYRHETDTKCNNIGNILHLPAIEVEKCFGEYNVQVADDKYTCEISDMCMCTNGCLAMVDFTNKRIKIMNDSFKVISILKVSSQPIGICEINSSMLAVTLWEGKVLFTSQEDPMKVKHSFKLGFRCRGIVCNDGMIYVCCGGWKGSDEVEEDGRFKVFSISGVLQYELSNQSGIEWPRRMAFSSSSKRFFVIDGYRGIIQIDKNRSITKVTVDNKAFISPCSICKITMNLFCVANESGNLLLMSHDGKDQVELLIKHARKENPFGMCFDNKTSRLVVSHRGSNKVVVYTLRVTD